jgi:SAM-dependent methyltransferase
MRARHQVFNSLLKLQADFSFQPETSLLDKSIWAKTRTVLDYGCGNGYFSQLLSEKHPEMKFYCCDRDKDILSYIPIGKQFIPIQGEYQTINLPEKIDFFVVRHLISYLHNRAGFFNWLHKCASENASLLLIDAFDENLVIEPYMENFQKGLDKFQEEVKSAGGNRDLFGVITEELENACFYHEKTEKIIVCSSEANMKEKLFVYMNLVAELDNGLPLSELIREELMDWVTNDKSYLQYGLFAALFKFKSTAHN